MGNRGVAPHLLGSVLVLLFHSHLPVLNCEFRSMLCSPGNKRLILCCALNIKVELLMHQRKGK